MWKALYCYLTGQHEYGVTCEPGHIFLRCRNCGKQSSGWAVRDTPGMKPPLEVRAIAPVDTRVRVVQRRAA